MMLNRVSLNTIGLNRIGLNRIGKPSRASSDRPYIDPEVLASLKAVCICYGKNNDDPDRAVVKNLVDPSNPFIISNAAFKLNSGFGEYEQDFTDWKKSSKVTSFDSESIKFTSDVAWVLLYHPSSIGEDIPSFKVRIKLYGEGTLYYNYITQEGKYTNVAVKSEIFETPICYNTKYTGEKGVNVGFTLGVTFGECSGTITQIPSFEGAFVTDGVDDLITSTKTVQEMGITDEVTVVSMIHQIDKPSNFITTNNIRTSGSVVGRNAISLTDKTGIYGWYKDNIQGSTINVINNILGDKADYTASASSIANLSSKFSVVGYISNDSIVETSQVAWYWTIIANKVLTTDQINQVIAYFNLDRTLKPDILCNTIKQGITNENHAEFGDRLIDFSGNGRDIQLNNIAWKGDSGIGKYEVDFLDSSIWTSSNSTITSSKIDCKNAISHIMLLYYNVGGKEYPDIPSFKIIKTGADIDYSYIDETGSPKSVKIVDGVNVLPASHNTLYSGSGRFCGFGNPGIGNSVIITQIPSHAGALCLDGVNDFGKVTGMPVYKDYTVVADYIRTSAKENAADSSILSKSKVINNGAFLFNYLNVSSTLNSYSFGTNNMLASISDSERKIYYQSKYVNEGKSINSGTGTDYDSMWLGTYRDNVQIFFNGAIYSLMSFPYSMSEFLIERQLKKHKLGTLYPNMVEFRPIVKSNLPYSSISYSVNPGEYISVDSMVTITITLPNTSDKLMEVSCNAISDISISGDNGVYEITGKVGKSPQKINMIISSYLTMLSNSTLISNETLIKNE